MIIYFDKDNKRIIFEKAREYVDIGGRRTPQKIEGGKITGGEIERWITVNGHHIPVFVNPRAEKRGKTDYIKSSTGQVELKGFKPNEVKQLKKILKEKFDADDIKNLDRIEVAKVESYAGKVTTKFGNDPTGQVYDVGMKLDDNYLNQIAEDKSNLVMEYIVTHEMAHVIDSNLRYGNEQSNVGRYLHRGMMWNKETREIDADFIVYFSRMDKDRLKQVPRLFPTVYAETGGRNRSYKELIAESYSMYKMEPEFMKEFYPELHGMTTRWVDNWNKVKSKIPRWPLKKGGK